MRLIDADEATRLSKEHTGKRLLAIDTAPTVEAIPVEWIKNQIKDHPGMHAASWHRLLELWETEGRKDA